MDKQQLSNRISEIESHIQILQADIQRMQNDLNQKLTQQVALIGAKDETTRWLNVLDNSSTVQ